MEKMWKLYKEGKTYREIANLVGMPPTSVNTYLGVARKAIETDDWSASGVTDALKEGLKDHKDDNIDEVIENRQKKYLSSFENQNSGNTEKTTKAQSIVGKKTTAKDVILAMENLQETILVFIDGEVERIVDEEKKKMTKNSNWAQRFVNRFGIN